MGTKKYNDALRYEIINRKTAGESYVTLSKAYNIPLKSIVYICENEPGGGTRGCMEHVKNDESVHVDARFKDARDFKTWQDRVIKHLKQVGTYKEQQIIHVGKTDFTYRSKKGYNATKNYVDLYRRIKGNE